MPALAASVYGKVAGPPFSTPMSTAFGQGCTDRSDHMQDPRLALIVKRAALLMPCSDQRSYRCMRSN